MHSVVGADYFTRAISLFKMFMNSTKGVIAVKLFSLSLSLRPNNPEHSQASLSSLGKGGACKVLHSCREPLLKGKTQYG